MQPPPPPSNQLQQNRTRHDREHNLSSRGMEVETPPFIDTGDI